VLATTIPEMSAAELASATALSPLAKQSSEGHFPLHPDESHSALGQAGWSARVKLEEPPPCGEGSSARALTDEEHHRQSEVRPVPSEPEALLVQVASLAEPSAQSPMERLVVRQTPSR
jgi:hypothetical protein